MIRLLVLLMVLLLIPSRGPAMTCSSVRLTTAPRCRCPAQGAPQGVIVYVDCTGPNGGLTYWLGPQCNVRADDYGAINVPWATYQPSYSAFLQANNGFFEAIGECCGPNFQACHVVP